MVDIELSLGVHDVLWSLDGYADLIASITVAEAGVTCDSVTGIGECYITAPVTAPGVLITAGAPFTVTGYLKESVVTDFTSWIESKGGAEGIAGDLMVVGEIIDGYGDPTYLGFEVTLADVGTVLDYYGG